MTVEIDRPTPCYGGVDLGFDFGPLSQKELISRSDVMVIRSEKLKDDLTIVGVPQLVANIHAPVCHTDLVVTLVDVYPNGEPFLITEGIKRFSMSDSEVQVSFWPTAYTVKAGHKMGLVLAGAKYPKYDFPGCICDSYNRKNPLLDREPSSVVKYYSVELFSYSVLKWELRLPILPHFEKSIPPSFASKPAA